MIGWLRTWLMSVLVVSLLCALAEAMMPEGAVRRVGKLVCGLALLCGVLWPIVQAGPLVGPDWSEAWALELEREQSRLEERLGSDMKQIIEENCDAYIQDKAAQRHRSWKVHVVCREEGGLYVPDRAEVYGNLSTEESRELARLLTEDLGIPPERQNRRVGEEGP